MQFQEGAMIFTGFCYGISATLLMKMLSRCISNKEKQRRTKALDMIDLEIRTKILTTQAGNIILSQHKTADQTRQNFKDILKRVKELEEVKAIDTNEIRILRSHKASLTDRVKNLESYIKQFSTEDLKRMQHDNEQVESLLRRLAITESTLKAHSEISNKP